MSIHTIYRCDVCGKVVDASSDIAKVHVGIASTNYGSFGNTYSIHNHSLNAKDFCNECLIAYGIKRLQNTPLPATAPITIEDLIRLIVQEEVSNAS